MPYLTQHRQSQNFLEALLRDHGRYTPIVEILDKIVLHLDQLSWADAELIGLELGRQNGSEFCAGIRAGMVHALDADQGAPRDEKRQALLDFALKLNQDSSRIQEQDIERLRRVGWSDQTIEDVIGLAATLKAYSIMANGFGFKGLPQSVFAEMGEATVQQKGYLPIFLSFVEQMNGTKNTASEPHTA